MKYFKKLMSVFIVVIFSFIFVSCDNKNKSNENSSLLKIHFIDVGQADSILIQQGNENMIIDAGNNDDEEILKNYINNLGIKDFKYVVGTHAHEDHIGSLDYIVNSFKVGKVYFPKTSSSTKTFENLLNAVNNKNMKFIAPTVGETFNLGDAKCTILAPNGKTYTDANNYSIVIKLEYGNNSFLFTGDAEDVSEKEMIANGLNLKSDVLKVGHHGSKSSTTDDFLDAINPKYAVISVGKDNDYGHPNNGTLDKLNKRGIKVYRTDESGTIIATSDGKNINFSISQSHSDTEGSKNNVDKLEDKINNLKEKEIINENKNSDTAQKGENETVWVASSKSKVYHKDSACSNMNNPKQHTLEEAENKGLKPCSKCYK